MAPAPSAESVLARVEACAAFRLHAGQREKLLQMIRREQATGLGGIVNLEAGWGKTLLMIGQALAFPETPTLMITEPSLEPQLRDDLNTFLKPSVEEGWDGWSVFNGDGLAKSRETCRQLATALRHRTPRVVLITTYTQCAKMDGFLHRAEWGRVLVDEVHRIRNGGTYYAAVGKFVNARVRWGFSGSMVQNTFRDPLRPLAWALHDAGVLKLKEADAHAVVHERGGAVINGTLKDIRLLLPPELHMAAYMPWKFMAQLRLRKWDMKQVPPNGVIELTCWYEQFVPKMFIHYEYSSELVMNLIKRQKAIIKKMQKEIKERGRSDIDPRAFLVLDDCLASAGAINKDAALKWLAFNGRHAHVTLVFAFQ
ncbi:MAG: P-loop containing nucleoside triphosphate hydrolase protein [Monoraphidium minutum]|nr:MAG: P-loop containing nucleoside triphosphate hydrolase protein [Monoraphidium minutum]